MMRGWDDCLAAVPDCLAAIPDCLAAIPACIAAIPDFSPVIPAKAGIQTANADGTPARAICPRAAHLVRIRIYGIIGFSGFNRLVFDWQALIRIRPGGFVVAAKSAS